MSAEEETKMDVDVETDVVASTPPAGEEDVESKPSSKAGKKKTVKAARGRQSTGSSKKAPVIDSSSKSFSIGDMVLGRLKGYPPWPARIANPEEVPSKVAATRPGKSSHIFCVQFFQAGDYSWLNSRELTPLTSSEIEAYLAANHRSKSKNGLREAYETAQDPSEWDAAQEKMKANVEEEEEEEVDELEEEETGGKRKRPAAEKKEKKKKAKTEKKKSRASAAEVPESEEEEAAPKSKGKAGAKSKAKPVAEKKTTKKADTKAAASVENQATAGEDDALANDPEAVKVKDWRHKLQRAFLGKTLPTAAEMDQYDTIFKTIEEYEKMSIEYLQHSKIGKVMKKIATLVEIPRNDEFKITDRAAKLMHDWTSFIASNETGATTNGTKDEEKEAASASAEEPAAVESEKKDDVEPAKAVEPEAEAGSKADDDDAEFKPDAAVAEEVAAEAGTNGDKIEAEA
ncbi:hypothetical protein P7C73_g4197, partial [Tremellales sp. Uapishka_1]